MAKIQIYNKGASDEVKVYYHDYIAWQYHREDGPAVEHIDGRSSWWLNGEQIDCTSQEEFEKLLKLKPFW